VKKARAIVTAEGKFIRFDDLVASLQDPELMAECGAVLAMAHVDHGTTAQSVCVCIGYFISVCAGEARRMPKLPASVIKRAAGKRS
jgi:hypothetical protein